MEEKSKKREWIKNIAIIFLAVLLVLTFFSNTILNHSLPEVSTYMVGSGSITTQVRGTGMVEAVDPYNVIVKETRRVSSVAVRVDQEVEVGDILYYLAEEESEELKAAQKELESLKNAYEKMILQGGFTRAQVAEVESGAFGTLEQFQTKLEGINNAIDTAQGKVDAQQKKVDDIQKQLSLLENTTADTSKESKALAEAQKKLKEAQVELNNCNALLATLDENSLDPEEIALYEKTKTRINELSILVTKLEGEVTMAQFALDQKIGNSTISNQIASLTKQKVNEEVLLKDYTTELENAKAKQSEELQDIIAKMDLAESYKGVVDKESEVSRLRENSLDGVITSPVAGRITSMGYVAGESTSPDVPAAVIQLSGKGYTLSFPVTVEQARKVKIGDPVSIVNGWYYNDINVNLVSIQTDKENPRKNKILKFDLSGESVVPGENITLSIGQKSTDYDLIVPNSAIREDNNGKFVLQFSTRSTPFGSRYIAKRVNVEVLASDDNYSAITADSFANYGEYVITTASEPIKNGQQVRLAQGAE